MRSALFPLLLAASLPLAYPNPGVAQQPTLLAVAATSPAAFTSADAGISSSVDVSSSAGDLAEADGLPEAPAPEVERTLHRGRVDPGVQPYMLPNGKRISQYKNTIPPGVSVTPYTAMEKEHFMVHQMFRPKTLVAATFSAGFEHLLNAPPHYGTNSGAFAQRFGAALASAETQTVAMDGILAPLLGDDPRYFQMGPGHSIAQRAIYAAKNVVITRADDGTPAINLPKLGGYAAVDVVKYTTYYPDQDRNGNPAFGGYITSLAGALIGYEIEEFMPDLMSALHHKKK